MSFASPLETTAANCPYHHVRENFKRVQEFGWFLPATSHSFYYDTDGSASGGLGYRQAAVMFLLSYYKGSLHVLMTKRSNVVRTHKGHECLPGGGREPEETSPVQTALRETQEETGLDPSHISVVAVAPRFAAGIDTLTVISPIICVLNTDPENLKLKACEREVDCVYWMPIEIFLEDKNMEIFKMHFPSVKRIIYRSFPSFHFNSTETGLHHFVWGLTAHICLTLSAIALNRVPVFPHSVNMAISSIQREDTRLRLVLHYVSLTETQRKEWKGCRKVIPNIPLDKWAVSCSSVSKL